MTTTATEPASSWSVKAETKRWLVKNPSQYVKSYLVDCSAYRLGPTFYQFSLMAVNPSQFRVLVASLTSNDPAPVEEAALSQVSQLPIMEFVINASPEAALEKFERVVSNVMHRRLEPTTVVKHLWEKALDM